MGFVTYNPKFTTTSNHNIIKKINQNKSGSNHIATIKIVIKTIKGTLPVFFME